MLRSPVPIPDAPSTAAVRSRPAAVTAATAAVVTVAALLAGTAAFVAATAPTARADTPPGIHVSDGRVVEADGTDLVLRGVNHAHTWYTHTTGAFADIKAAGANSVRVVLSSGDQWTRNTPEDVRGIVDLCQENRLVCILEVHDTTGYGDTSAPDAATLDQAVDYWEDLYPTLTGTEDFVMVNIGNEPMGNDDATNATWGAETSAAIERLRTVGYEHAIVVDAPNWGQDWTHVMEAQAADVFASDPDANTVFSIHMYGVYAQAQSVTDYLEHFVDAGLPLVVGEFGWRRTDGDVDEDVVLAEAERLDLGWLAWSWSGNTDPYLDMVLGFDATDPSAWGTRVIDGPDGLRETAVEASWFGGGPTDPPTDEPTDPPTDEPTDPPADQGCTATVRVTGSWPGGWQGELVVTAGDAPITGWEASFALPAGVAVTQLWGGSLTSTQDGVVVTHAAWNGALAADGSATAGFLGSGTAPAAAPAVTCTAS
ncbi:cellulase family glycosylhydrolase [Isoptericola sp. NEAU-Y5]|uniref:Endoglucanase n=1 Tax=Isoptericola luteus TaxID=2879484 RepID=A0ABS7ZAP2_9MICO|nr:cellulase family glycosylhydrolase [Isoptericola sp. NEAU-Y5]MCA5892126.1 cellulase family glycosylhydrolase [Isoptericola sp. NEAU-Y5]